MLNTGMDTNTSLMGGEIESKPISGFENTKQNRGRKRLKPNDQSKKKKKEPKRGKGVAQLELERLGQTQQQKNPFIIQSPHILPSSHYFIPAPYPDPTPPGYGQLLGLNQSLLLQRFGYGSYGGLGDYQSHGLGSDQVRVGPYNGFGEAMDKGSRGGRYLGENSKELSSIPNPVRYPAHDQCGLCHKKKRVMINGGSLGCNIGMREKYGAESPISLINGCSFNVGIHGINVHKGVEVGVHRKGSSGAFMEYDFFPPGKGGCRGTSTNELDLSLFSEASVAVLGGGGGGDGGSCVTTNTAFTSTGFDASTSIDLSLKLSC